MNRSLAITILGHVCIDQNISEHASYTAPGSPAMFLSKIFSQLPNCYSTIISPYGNDFLPYAKSVSLYPQKPTAKNTLVYANITKQKHRTQKALHIEEATPIQTTVGMHEMLQKTDILYIAPILSNFSSEYIKSITNDIVSESLIVLSPQGYFREIAADHSVVVREFLEASTVLPLVDVVIVSEQDHPQMKQLAKQWAKDYHVIVLVTTGECGADVFTPDDIFSIPTDPVAEKDIVDSVGSGDIFSAGFGYWYKKTGDLKVSVRFANQLARQCLFYTSEEITIDYLKLIGQ